MALTQEQLGFFDAFGYLMIPQLFLSSETDEIIEAFEWTIQNCGGIRIKSYTRIDKKITDNLPSSVYLFTEKL